MLFGLDKGLEMTPGISLHVNADFASFSQKSNRGIPPDLLSVLIPLDAYFEHSAFNFPLIHVNEILSIVEKYSHIIPWVDNFIVFTRLLKFVP